MNLNDIENNVYLALENNDIESALQIIKKCVYEIFLDDAATGEVFGSRKLDELCLLIGKQAKKNCDPITDVGVNLPKGILFLVSHIERYGGHSKVCIDLANQVFPAVESSIIVTNIHGKFSEDEINVNCPVIVCPDAPDINKLIWLINKINTINPTKIILFNHHQDAVLIAALEPFIGSREIIYYHHADHNLALGVHLPNVSHVDPTNIGYFSCREGEGLKDNLYFPLAIKDRGSRSSNFCEQDIKTCSSGSYGPKFGIPYKFRYFDFIISRLILRDGIHFHVGNIPENSLAEFRKDLNKNNISLDRFINVPYVDSLWDFLVNKKIDLYISSFPMAGARATMEAMGAGVPILLHDSPFQRFFAGKDSAYPEVFLWKTKEQFDEFIELIDPRSLIKASSQARNRYLAEHSVDKFLEYVLDAPISSCVHPPPLVEHAPERLETYLYKKSLIEKPHSPPVLKNKIDRLEWENKVLNETKDASEKIIHSWRSIVLLAVKKYNYVLKKIEYITYLKKRIDVLNDAYGSPLTKGNYSRYLGKRLLKLMMTTSLFNFIKQERNQLSKIFKLQERLKKPIVRLSHDDLKNLFLSDHDGIDIVYFDHFGGGGSNLFTNQFLAQAEVDAISVARIGFYDGFWFLVIKKYSREKIYITLFESSDQLFDFLPNFNIREYVINSMYGVPDLVEFSKKLKSLFDKITTPYSTRFILHDYFALCPSLHLLNSSSRYCGVPESKNCNLCYSDLNLKLWSHSWIDFQKIPKTNDGWRKIFSDLFSSIDQIIYFNTSTIDIFRKAFPQHLDRLSLLSVELGVHASLTPVKRGDYLSIGVMGNLSSVKGVTKVKELAEYLKNQRNSSPITVIGESNNLPDNVRRHGRYEIETLPKLIEELEVNVIFFASIVPETFSYVLSEIFAMKLPVVCFDLGAQADRVLNYPLGIVIPLKSSPSQVYQALERASNLF